MCPCCCFEIIKGAWNCKLHWCKTIEFTLFLFNSFSLCCSAFEQTEATVFLYTSSPEDKCPFDWEAVSSSLFKQRCWFWCKWVLLPSPLPAFCLLNMKQPKWRLCSAHLRRIRRDCLSTTPPAPHPQHAHYTPFLIFPPFLLTQHEQKKNDHKGFCSLNRSAAGKCNRLRCQETICTGTWRLRASFSLLQVSRTSPK